MSKVPDNSQRPPAHILCVSYDESLLLTRRLLLEGRGYKVMPSVDLDDCIRRCRESAFDLFILGHSIAATDQLKMMKAFREHSTAPVLLLRRQAEADTAGADYYAFPDEPKELLRLVGDILGKPLRMRPRIHAHRID